MRASLLLLLLAVACAREATPPDDRPGNGGVVLRDPVEYRATTAVLESFPVQLVTTVTLLNRSAVPVSLVLPDQCSVLLRAYRDAQARTPAYDAQQSTACALAIVEITLPPDGTHSFTARSDARTILGDSLPDGRYWLRALLRPNGSAVEVPAGDVELAVPR